MESKIKVLQYISTGFVAGEVQHLLTLTKNLNKRYFKIDVVCFEGTVADYLRGKNLCSQGVELKTIKFEGDNRFNTFLSLFKLIHKEKYQVVHIHPVSLGGIAARLAARLAGAKIVTTESSLGYRHSWEKNPFLSFFGLHLLHPIWNGLFLDRMIAISQAVYDAVIQRERINPEKVTLVHYGIEVDNFRTSLKNVKETKKGWGLDDELSIIGTMGRLGPQKGISYLIDAFARVVKKIPKIKLLIVGEGLSRPSLERQCKELGLSKKVIFTGWREDIPGLLGIMDIFILPSIYEPLGLAAIEAMASGKPTIVTRTGGLTDIVEHEKTGLLVAPKDVEALAKAMLRL